MGNYLDFLKPEVLHILMSFVFGAIFAITVVRLIHQNVENKETKLIDSLFQDIYNNRGKLSFLKRVNMYVYLKYNDQELIYLLDKDIFYLYHTDVCLATSARIQGNVVFNKLKKFVSGKFEYDISNIVIIENNVYSMNVFSKFMNPQQFENIGSAMDQNSIKSNPEDHLNLDDILDKINNVGLDNLTNKERDFLEKYSK